MKLIALLLIIALSSSCGNGDYANNSIGTADSSVIRLSDTTIEAKYSFVRGGIKDYQMSLNILSGSDGHLYYLIDAGRQGNPIPIHWPGCTKEH